MLVLSRKIDESVQIGDQITVTVLKVKGNTVRIGIDAPKSVRVVRGELEPKSDKKSDAKAKGSQICFDLPLENAESQEGSVVEFSNKGKPEVKVEPFDDRACGTIPKTDRLPSQGDHCHDLPLSRFCKPEYRVDHFRIAVEESTVNQSTS